MVKRKPHLRKKGRCKRGGIPPSSVDATPVDYDSITKKPKGFKDTLMDDKGFIVLSIGIVAFFIIVSYIVSTYGNDIVKYFTDDDDKDKK